MVKQQTHLQMVMCIQEIMLLVSQMEQEYTNGNQEAFTQENLKKDSSMGLVNGPKTLISQNPTITKANMLTKEKMVREHSHGKTETLITETIQKMKEMVMENSNGQ